jgi:hypothetical protein
MRAKAASLLAYGLPVGGTRWTLQLINSSSVCRSTAAYERLSKLGGAEFEFSLSDTLGGQGGIADLVKEKAGASIDGLIQADQGTERQGVVKGLGQLLGGQPGTSVPAEPAASQPEEPRKKKAKNKQAKGGRRHSRPTGVQAANAESARQLSIEAGLAQSP